MTAVTQVPKGPRSFYKDGEAASVRWDANDRVKPAEPESDGIIELKKNKFNADCDGAWRLDLDAPVAPAAAAAAGVGEEEEEIEVEEQPALPPARLRRERLQTPRRGGGACAEPQAPLRQRQWTQMRRW